MNITNKLEIVKGTPARNRIVMPAMDTLMANGDGNPNDFHIQHYGARAYGGVGTIIVESASISSEGKIRKRDIGIWKDSQIEGHKRIVQISKLAGSVIGLQLNHAGAKAEMDDEDRIGTTKYYDYLPMKRFSIITPEQMNQVVEKFVKGAFRAKEAGYDFVEVHAAHGYLLSELIDPKTNDVIKSDDITKRAELVIEIVKRIKQEVKITTGIRFSTSDHEDKGTEPIDFKPLVEKLDSFIDYYNISSGEVTSRTNVVQAMVKAGTSLFRIPLVKEFRKFTDKPLIMAGNVSTRDHVNEALRAGVDGVAIGREIIFNPYLVVNTLLTAAEVEPDIYHWNNNIWFNPHAYSDLKEKLSEK